MFKDIKMHHNWKLIEKINKGWSSDDKYFIETNDDVKLLLRISDINTYEQKKMEYDIICKYSKLGITMSMPLEFGICNNNKNVYMLLTWIEGIDLADALPNLPVNEQYNLGRKAGNILRQIHSIEVIPELIPITTKIPKKQEQINRYINSNVRIENDDIALKYINDNINKMWTQKPCYQHGDFHPGNLIYMPNGEIGVIDFNRWEISDPYEEFYKLESFGVEVSIPYCIGQIDAYFNDDIPVTFWETLAVYVAHASLFSIKWAEKFGQDDIDGMKERCRQAFYHYNNFNNIVPNWYEQGLNNY